MMSHKQKGKAPCPPKWPYGGTYFWKGVKIGVVKGLGDCYIVAKETNGGHKRIVSKFLPVCTTPEEAQKHLDDFAADRGLLMMRRGDD